MGAALLFLFVSRSESAKALVALTWTCVYAEAYLKREENFSIGWSKLVELQSSFYYGAQAGQFKSVANSAYRAMKRFWKKVSFLSQLMQCS